jgi:hypothetical protein
MTTSGGPSPQHAGRTPDRDAGGGGGGGGGSGAPRAPRGPSAVVYESEDDAGPAARALWGGTADAATSGGGPGSSHPAASSPAASPFRLQLSAQVHADPQAMYQLLQPAAR